jgi:hypothetical protein
MEFVGGPLDGDTAHPGPGRPQKWHILPRIMPLQITGSNPDVHDTVSRNAEYRYRYTGGRTAAGNLRYDFVEEAPGT